MIMRKEGGGGGGGHVKFPQRLNESGLHKKTEFELNWFAPKIILYPAQIVTILHKTSDKT